jgi:hypothetical protein
MYASVDGIVMMVGGQAKIVTENVISERFWRKLNPSSIHAYFFRDKYFGFYDSGTAGVLTMETGEKIPGKGGFIFDRVRNSLVFTDVTCDAAYSDRITGTLYLVKNVAGVNTLYQWDGSATNISMLWTTKTIITAECCPSAARVDAKRYPVTVKVYGDGKLTGTYSVANSSVFRLNAGYRARQWAVEISGDSIVQGVFMATSVEELKR